MNNLKTGSSLLALKQAKIFSRMYTGPSHILFLMTHYNLSVETQDRCKGWVLSGENGNGFVEVRYCLCREC